MVNPIVTHSPTISFRPVQPSDLHTLERIHDDIFPIRYEPEFFQNVVSGSDIVSWVAVDLDRPDGQSDEPIGFITTRIIPAKESEIMDFLRYDLSKSDQTLVYILTLGVVETYRNLGIATSLLCQVIKYASSIPNCLAVYLHVIAYNSPAIRLYKKMSFKCLQRLPGFYLINGQYYDGYLFVHFLNGGGSLCSPLELVTVMVSYMRNGCRSVVARLRKNPLPKWPKCKHTRCLVSPTTQTKTNITIEDNRYEYI